ncbi:MAG: IPT/TIG domain-containing protein [Spirochaetaceae bacterium]|jgi:transglutaminase-like putative cysteine protease|nr:IPT/TIG domain-containing protein [Spirochaetaceae bacterium]
MNSRASGPKLFILAGLLAALLSGCEKKDPRILSLEPRIGMMGEPLTIHGKNFGHEQNESSVSIGGVPPTASSYIEWSDNRIVLRVPEFGEAGLVYVYAGGKKSNAALFSNRANMPLPVRSAQTGSSPRIRSIEPASGAVGTLVTITGQNFGSSREGSLVSFSWDAELAPAAQADASRPVWIAVPENEFGYESWSDQEIKVRVPDGAISGLVEVRTVRGNSPGAYFDVNGRPGAKTFKDKRSYAISYSVDIRVRDAANPNSLYIWMPTPVVSASQRQVQLLSRSAEPFIEHYQGSTLYRLNNLRGGENQRITLSYLVDVYGVETELRPQLIRQTPKSVLQAAYTIPTLLLPVNDQRIKDLCAKIIGREQNPYLRAERIYQWIVTEGGIQDSPLSGGVIEAVESGKADSYMASLLFCSLARAAGIAALPVSGVLVERSRGLKRHYWAEFWIDGFGWIPCDPALGSGALDAAGIARPDRAAYYFGNLDSQRISFSRGEALLSQMDSRGRIAVRERDYALQTVWEEAAGGLESYSSLWSDIIITGAY